MKLSIELSCTPFLYFFFEKNTSKRTFIDCGIELEKYLVLNSSDVTDEDTWQVQKQTFFDIDRMDLRCGILKELYEDIKDYDWNITWDSINRNYYLNIELPSDDAVMFKLRWS